MKSPFRLVTARPLIGSKHDATADLRGTSAHAAQMLTTLVAKHPW